MVYPNFRKIFQEVFFPCNFARENFQKFRLSGSHFGNSTVSRISETFPGNFCTVLHTSELQGCFLPAGAKTYNEPYIKISLSTCPQILYVEKCIHSQLFKEAGKECDDVGLP